MGQFGAVSQGAADFFERRAAAQVGFADAEIDPLDRAQRVVEHQPLELGVVGPAPVAAGKESPADLNRAAIRRVIRLEPRRADDRAAGLVDHRQRTAFGQRIIEEGSKYRLLPAIMRGVQFPDQRVAGDREKRVPVIGAQRPDLQAFPGEDRLAVHVTR